MNDNNLHLSVKKVFSVSQRCIFHDLDVNYRYIFPTLLIFSSISIELFAVTLMSVISRFYFTITNHEVSDFFNCLQSAIVSVTIIAFFVAVNNFASDGCSLQWREDLVHNLHCQYFCNGKSYDVLNKKATNNIKPIDNPDQRIVQDSLEFTSISSKLLGKAIPLPAVVIFYSWHLWKSFGWVTVASCYLYFIISTSVVSILTNRIIPIISYQDNLEGDFRYRHTRYRINVEPIMFLKGENTEKDKLNHSFYLLCQNMRYLIIQRIPLYFTVSWFSYVGSVVNYAAVGLTLLFIINRDSSLSPAETASKLAQGSYACLYLVGSFTSIIDMAENFSKLCGYANRLDELIKATYIETSSSITKEVKLPIYSKPSNQKELGKINIEPSFRQKWFPNLPMNNNNSLSFCSLWISIKKKFCSNNSSQDSLYSLLKIDEDFGEGFHSDHVELQLFQPELQKVSPQDSHGITANFEKEDKQRTTEKDSAYNEPSDIVEPLCSLINLSLFILSRHNIQCCINNLNLEIFPGMRLLISGESGQGKTLLLRFIRGLFPTAVKNGAFLLNSDVELQEENLNTGQIIFNCSEDDVSFIPQSLYYSEGSIEDNIAYPLQFNDHGHDLCSSILKKIGLDQYQFGHSDASQNSGFDRFGTVLSCGEQQKLALGRIFFRKPKIVFLDESTSSLDEVSEFNIYSSLIENFRHGAIVSIDFVETDYRTIANIEDFSDAVRVQKTFLYKGIPLHFKHRNTSNFMRTSSRDKRYYKYSENRMNQIWELLLICCNSIYSFFCSLCCQTFVQFDSGRKVRVDAIIGEGAFSFVYKAYSAREQFALKKMYMQSGELQSSTKTEIESLKKFQHPNIIKMIDFSFAFEPKKGQVAYILFPFSAKGSLRDLLNVQNQNPNFRPSLSGVISGFRDICSAVNVLHTYSSPFVHRDIKTENILFDDNWTPLLIDFGSVSSANISVLNRQDSVRIADESAQFCTVSYRPPELFEPPIGIQLDTRTDVWSLGCLLFAWYYGYSPFESEFNENGTLRVVECSHLRVLSRCPRRSKPSADDLIISSLCDWILEKEFHNRPFTIDIIKKLEEVLINIGRGFDMRNQSISGDTAV